MIPEERISRFLSFLLRHRPRNYPLSFDGKGFVQWEDLVQRVEERFPRITEDELLAVIQGSEKRRFEYLGGKVRATYGHSFPVDLGLKDIIPPSLLYHGTARDLAHGTLKEGLKPRGRQYVHLSPSVGEAIEVGKRRDPFPAVLLVNSLAAHEQGISFYQSGPLFLAKMIPPKFLSIREQ